MRNIVIKSFDQVDLSDLAIPVIAVFRHPDDMPEKCVARVFDGVTPTNVVMIANTTKELEKNIRKNTGMARLPKTIWDDTAVVSTWI